jgi:hypothetical protein
MPDETPSRIRWKHAPGIYAGPIGYVGSLDTPLFRVYDPQAPDGDHTLTTMLQGMGNRLCYGTEAEVKAQAEEWLSEFVSSLGAAFPVAAGQETQLQEGSE